jgi:predicted molibdopterin-dependent oxidoreductase YjgC
MKSVLTICPYCGCGCGLYLISDGKRIIGSYPSSNHPVSKNSLCVKGWNAYEFLNRLDRLTTPLIKRGKKRFVPTSWDVALNLITRRFRFYKDKYGSDSLGFLSSAKATNEENFLMMKLARAVFKTNNIDHCARLCHASTVVGLAQAFGSGAMTNSIEDFNKAELFLVTGSDTTNQHPLIGCRIINAVKEKGAKLIVVDPRRIELAKHAHIYVQPKNGTDVAWINAIINVIISEGLYNERFIKERTENFQQLKEVVKEYTPEVAEKITSVPKEKITKIAHLYAEANSAMIIYSMGITQHTSGVDNVKSLANLAMVTGKVGTVGSGLSPLRGQNNVQGACDMGALPDNFCGYQKVTDEKVRKKFELAWGVEGFYLCFFRAADEMRYW